MEIHFISKANNLTADDGEHYFKEDEELTYTVSIMPAGNHYELKLLHDPKATDRLFLSKVYELREMAALDNKVLFETYYQGNKIGDLSFLLPPQLSYPVSSVVMTFNKIDAASANLLLVFKRLSNFVITLDTGQDVVF